MVRSAGGNALGLFEEGLVGIHFGIPNDLSGKTLEEIRNLFITNCPGLTKSKIGGAVGMLDRIVNTMREGDGVVTYDQGTRHYWIGRIVGDYYFVPGEAELPHRRRVRWDDAMVSRDDLTLGARNSLGSTLSLFSISPAVWQEMLAAQSGKPIIDPNMVTTDDDDCEELEEEKKSLVEKARERLKDRIVAMDDGDMEELLAAVLRAMGFRTRVSAKGPDRGVDVLASPDGLGLQEPRIKCEVKHRKNTAMGAQEVRSFLGALRAGDRGIYLSTGGFTREARYESERATVPVSLMDLDDLARLIETHYESFDTDGRGLLPLTKVYWPAD